MPSSIRQADDVEDFSDFVTPPYLGRPIENEENISVPSPQEYSLAQLLEAAVRSDGYCPRIIGQLARSAENTARTILKYLGRPIQNEENIAVPSPQDRLKLLSEVIARINRDSDANSPARTICTPRPEITDWERGNRIGKGSFGSVYKGYSKEHKIFFAAKGVALDDHGHIRHLENEIAILKPLDHENIIQFYGTERGGEMLYIFLELENNGTLEQAYKDFRFEESQISDYTRQILQGLRYLHSCKVVHGDLKCANILVTKSGILKLADFGFSRSMEDHSQSLNLDLQSSYWMAPEVANPKGIGYGFPSDIWSLGCTVTELSTRKHPRYIINGENDLKLESAIRSGKGPIVPDYLSDTLKDFINQCLRPDPNQRPAAADLLAHPFVAHPFVDESS